MTLKVYSKIRKWIPASAGMTDEDERNLKVAATSKRKSS
jgi:hypothetical protein